jgi:hypothetical protein
MPHDGTLRLHPKQFQAFTSPATEILFGGAAGGGKSHLLRVAALSWCYGVPGLQVYLFRRTYQDLWKNHVDGPTGFPALLAPWIASGHVRFNHSAQKIFFWNGSVIHLCHCQHEKNKINYQGAEIDVLMIDELTHFPESVYRYLRGRLRQGHAVPLRYRDFFPRILCSSNPGNIGHTWVKLTWVDFAPAMQIEQASRDEGGMRRQFIPSLLEDNPTLAEYDPHYEDRLYGLGTSALVRALRWGDWDIVAGGMFHDVWPS